MAGAAFAYEVVITMRFTVEIEREEDGRWLAKIPELSGVLVYGQTRTEAISRVQAPRAAGVGRSSHIPIGFSGSEVQGRTDSLWCAKMLSHHRRLNGQDPRHAVYP